MKIVIQIDRLFCVLLVNTIGDVVTTRWKFETNCIASQFRHLENLIGSFHSYASDSDHLAVRDLGLTHGQQILLSRYKNIQVISSSSGLVENSLTIAVDEELFLDNGTLLKRLNKNNFKYIDLIQKRVQLAVVVPFIADQLPQLMNRLNLDQIYPPCRHRMNFIDLIFYHNEEKFSLLDQQIRRIEYPNLCFQNIRYFAATLTQEEDRYPVGSAHMWKKLFSDKNDISLRSYGYTHFFLMEPDTRSIRAYWLEKLVELIFHGHQHDAFITSRWWMIGSIYRGFKPIGIHQHHINGNALYHLSSNLIDFLEQVSNEYPFDSSKSLGYDLDIFQYLFHNNFREKEYLHQFQFTDFIQNCWHTGCNDTHRDFPLNYPNTYLIHGGATKVAQKSNFLNPRLIILLFLFFGLVFVHFSLHKRKTYLRRSFSYWK